MTWGALVAACVIAMVSTGTPLGGAADDPISGRWGNDGLTFLELSFDGKSAVTGTTYWRRGGTLQATAPIRTGTFDPATATLKIEGDVTRPDTNKVVRYAIEGRVDKDTLSGTYQLDDTNGQFTFARLKAD